MYYWYKLHLAVKKPQENKTKQNKKNGSLAWYIKCNIHGRKGFIKNVLFTTDPNWGVRNKTACVWVWVQHVGAEGLWEQQASLVVANMFPNIMHSLSLKAPAVKWEENQSYSAACLSPFGSVASPLTSHFFSLAKFPVSNWRPTPLVSFSDFSFKSWQGVCVGLNPVFGYFQTQTAFSRATAPEVWPGRDRCCNGGWVVCHAWWGDTQPMLQRQAVQPVCGRISYTLHNFPKQRSLNPLKHTLSYFVPIICSSVCVSTSGTFMGTETLLWIVLQSRLVSNSVLFREGWE